MIKEENNSPLDSSQYFKKKNISDFGNVKDPLDFINFFDSKFPLININQIYGVYKLEFKVSNKETLSIVYDEENNTLIGNFSGDFIIIMFQKSKKFLKRFQQ